MLSSLLGSENRVKIFKIFFSDPDRFFSLEEIVKLGEGKIPSLSKELDKLVSDGFLKLFEEEPEKGEAHDVSVEEKGKKAKKSKTVKKVIKKEFKIKKYQANSEHIFFPEIASIIAKEAILSIKDLFSQIKKDFNPKMMFLAGKFVSDDSLPTDLFIVGTPPRRDILAAIAKLEKKLGYEINFTIMSEQEFDYRREVADVFLFNVLEAKKIVISGDLL